MPTLFTEMTESLDMNLERIVFFLVNTRIRSLIACSCAELCRYYDYWRYYEFKDFLFCRVVVCYGC